MEVSICPVAHLGAVEAGIAEILACYILLTCCRVGLKAAVACVAPGNDAVEIGFVEDTETLDEQLRRYWSSCAACYLTLGTVHFPMIVFCPPETHMWQ